jgi:hypothetical protein
MPPIKINKTCCFVWHRYVRSLCGQNVPHFIWKRKINYRVKATRHWTLTWTRWIESTPSLSIYFISILIVSSNQRLGLAINPFLISILTEAFYTFLIAFMRATCPAHLIPLDLISIIIFAEEHNLQSNSSCNCLSLVCYIHIFSSLNILSCILPNRVRVQASDPYKTTGNILEFYMVMFRSLFLGDREIKYFELSRSNYCFNLSLTS